VGRDSRSHCKVEIGKVVSLNRSCESLEIGMKECILL
jgi:hypothetical protein